MQPAVSSPADAIRDAEGLLADGDARAAIDLLVEYNRRCPDVDVETHLVGLRSRAFAQVDRRSGRPEWPPTPDDRFASHPGIPEIGRDQLDAATIAAGVQGRGALIVRGLFDPAAMASFRDIVDEVFIAAEDIVAQRPVAVPPWYVPFEASDGYDFGWLDRMFSRHGGGVLAAEAPRALFALVETLAAARVTAAVSEFFGEWPALSVKKTTLRRAEPDSLSGWHQDGAFLGDDIRTVNIWIALSDAGVDAPGLDIVPRRFDTIVPTGTEGARFDWSVSESVVDEVAAGEVERPVFVAGDAILFDQLTLHRTGVEETMTKTRHAIEAWFFAPSAYPHEQIPLCL